jgi:hypothetical protein
MVAMRMCDQRVIDGHPGIYVEISRLAVETAVGDLQEVVVHTVKIICIMDAGQAALQYLLQRLLLKGGINTWSH